MPKMDIPNTYSTIYTDPTKQDCKQAESIIQGIAGKQIQLEQIALSLMVTKSGITGTAWVTVEYFGVKETKITEFTETKTSYQAKSFIPGVVVPTGLGITLRFYLTTTDKAYRSRMTGLNYTYSLVDVPVIVEPDTPIVDTTIESPAIIYIKCPSGDVEGNIAKIKELIGTNGISIFEKRE